MKLFSAEIMTAGTGKAAKAVLVNKTSGGFSLLNHYITEPENLKALSGDAPVYLSTDYFDTIIETISVPPIKDHKTFRFLAKNKLKERLEEDTEYLITHKRMTEEKEGEGSTEHKVYLIPERVYDAMDVLSEKQKARTDIFTLSDFALCGISQRVSDTETIFHVYADKYKILITVSKGDVIIYTRMMDYETSESSKPEGIFYESINLTYMFVTKNMHINVDRMILSGEMIGMEGLSDMLFTFNGIPQSSIVPSQVISGCSIGTFKEFMLPIALCMLDRSYDFTPDEYREIRGFDILKTMVNSGLIAIVFFLAYLNIATFNELTFTIGKYKSDVKVVKVKLDDYKEQFKHASSQMYGLFYLKELEKRRKSVFDLYNDTADLIDVSGAGNVNFEIENSGKVVTINDKIEFDGLLETDKHSHMLSSVIRQMKSGSKLNINNNSKYDMNKMTADLRIKISKGDK